jgi:hypothetical protein
MEVFPDMEIRFPENQERELLARMRSRAADPWSWQPRDAFGRPPEDGHSYFHRRATDEFPPCTICLDRQRPGRLVVGNIVPDAYGEIPLSQCEHILKDFRDRIASPAARSLKGGTRLGPAQHSLEDYFSKNAIQWLRAFCLHANKCDLGRHRGDQELWMRFLRYVRRYYRNPPHCDVFGKCLKEKNWWPECDIGRLVDEYDFAMRLLAQAYHGGLVT